MRSYQCCYDTHVYTAAVLRRIRYRNKAVEGYKVSVFAKHIIRGTSCNNNNASSYRHPYSDVTKCARVCVHYHIYVVYRTERNAPTGFRAQQQRCKRTNQLQSVGCAHTAAVAFMSRISQVYTQKPIKLAP